MKKNKKSLLLILLALVIAVVYPVVSRLTSVDTDVPQTSGYVTITDNEEQLTGTDTEQYYESEAPPAETSKESVTESTSGETTKNNNGISESGTYYSKDEVALYIHTYGHLPSNFITKKEAQNLGWSGGSVEKYADGKAIGGDKFGNYENLLPKKNGRQYYECDIDTNGKSSRGAKRIIFSNDGLIYYTSNHYESFTQLY